MSINRSAVSVIARAIFKQRVRPLILITLSFKHLLECDVISNIFFFHFQMCVVCVLVTFYWPTIDISSFLISSK